MTHSVFSNYLRIGEITFLSGRKKKPKQHADHVSPILSPNKMKSARRGMEFLPPEEAIVTLQLLFLCLVSSFRNFVIKREKHYLEIHCERKIEAGSKTGMCTSLLQPEHSLLVLNSSMTMSRAMWASLFRSPSVPNGACPLPKVGLLLPFPKKTTFLDC